MRIIMRGMLVSALSALPFAASAINNNGQWDNVAPNIRSWFKGVRSPQGVPCCDISDGHRTDNDYRADGYWIPIPELPASKENWMRVPPEAVVYNAGNPTGDAVVWWVPQRSAEKTVIYIRCFVPGGGA